MPTRPNKNREFALLALLALLWGGSYPLIKIAVADIPPITLIAMRVSVAASVLLAVTLFRKAPLPKDWRTWKMLFVQAVLNSIGAWTVLAWGQQYIDSGLAGVLNSTSPLFVFAIGLLFMRHERATAWKLAGALLGLCGVILLFGLDVLPGLGANVLAQTAVLLGAALYAGAAIYGRRFSHLPTSVTAAGTMLWATLTLAPLSLIVDAPWRLSPSMPALLAAGALGVFCTAFALLLYFRLVRTIGSMGVASQSYLRAGVSVMLGIAFLGESLTPTVALGLLLIISGVAAINVTGSPSSRNVHPR
jgi:drug/metabolite transporter (DMT)-like permease